MNVHIDNLTPALKPSFAKVCLGTCSKIVAGIRKTKNALFREFRDSYHAQEHLLRLALNEAEALAWETGVPQLVFPTLAAEKAEATVAWQKRQGEIRKVKF